jgi:hypothetical protein
MKTLKVTHRVGGRDVACGCEFTRDKNGREQITNMCIEHEHQFIVRHAAAVASCSHANRDLTGG